jgi:hypothetical protein
VKLLLGLVFFSSLAHADYTGEMYELGSNRAKKLYSVKVEQKTNGEQEDIVATVTGVDGKVALIEKTSLKGIEVLNFEIDQKQLETTAVIKVGSEKVIFTKTKDGKTKEDDEKRKPTFVITGNFQKFIASRWAEIMTGKEVEFRYGVWDRMETVGFEVKKIGEEGNGEQKRVVLKMKPSSMIIAALVNPIEFKFTGDGKRLMEMKGRVGPKQLINGKWKDLDAEVVYTY